MSYKLDVRKIIRKHLSTLVNDNTGFPDFRDILAFLVIPIGVAIWLCAAKIFLDKDYINAIISGLSIYVGFAINLVVLLFSTVQKDNVSQLRKEFAMESIANITFSVLLSLLSIIFSLFTQLKVVICGSDVYFKTAMNGISYFLICEMILTILLLVRNMYFQLIDNVNPPDTDDSDDNS